jgi:hypothetical protein
VDETGNWPFDRESPKVPPEITDIVIDHLHDDKDALLMCSLVCKDWVPASRFHLFSPLVVTYESVTINNSILEHPLGTILPSIRHFQFRGWVHLGVPCVFAALPGLPSVHARFTSAADETILLPHIWNLRTLELTDVFLNDLGGLVDIFFATPSLENFTSRRLCWSSITPRRSVPKLPHLSPIRMEIENIYGEVVDHLAEWFGSDNMLQLVSLEIGRFDFRVIGSPIEFIAPFLENL